MRKSKMRRLWVAGLALVLALSVTGCGSSQVTADSAMMESSSYSGNAGAGLAKASFNADAGYEAAAEEAVADAGNDVQPQVPSGRKLIRTVNMSVETKDLDGLLADIQNRVAQLGGYIQDYTVGKESHYSYVTARVPVDKLDSFVDEVGEQANIVNLSESTEDVTLQYVDMESRKKALLTEQERLLALMEQAENVSDIIEIESRLSDVRYELESMESQLRTFDNQIDYSTIYIDITETETITPTEELSAFEKMGAGFMNSLYEVGAGLKNFAINFVICLPFIVVWVIIILIFVLVVRLIIKAVDKSRAKRGVQGKKGKLPPVFTKRSGQAGYPPQMQQQNQMMNPGQSGYQNQQTDKEKKDE